MQQLFAKNALLKDGWAQDVLVRIEKGKITAIDKNTTASAHDIDLGDQLLLPAIANVHSHSFQRAMAGLSERRGSLTDSFWTWRDVMYRFLDQLSVEDIYVIAAFTFMEMAEAGFASVGEFHYVHHQTGGVPYDDPAQTSFQIIEAAKTVGLGLTHLPVLYHFGGVNKEPLLGGQLRFGSDFDLFTKIVEHTRAALKNAPDDFSLGVAPHSLRAVNPDLLHKVSALLPERPIHMHISEQKQEVDQIKAKYGQRPIQWLLDHIDVNSRWCLIHCTHMTPRETKSLARSGAVAGLCPITEANLGDGIFDGQGLVGNGGAFGVGSDSNVRISLAEELRTLEHSQRYQSNARTVLAQPNGSNAEFLLTAAASGGAQALGRTCGAIKLGHWADMMSLDLKTIGATGLKRSVGLDYWTFAARHDRVMNLWSAGRHIVKNGQHKDRHPLEQQFNQVVQKLRALL